MATMVQAIRMGNVERAREEIRVACQMRIEQVNASAMECHQRRVGRLEAVFDVHLQDAVLVSRPPAIRAQEVFHRVMVHTFRPDNPGAEREEDGGSFHAQRIRRTRERPLLERPPRQVVNQAHGAGRALERGSSSR
jgi:hypothetical protein